MQRRLVPLLAVAAIARGAAADPASPADPASADEPASNTAPSPASDAAPAASDATAPDATAAGAPDSIEDVPNSTPPAIGRDARKVSLGTLFRGPFQSSRLFAMPTADVVGAYMLTLSGDASLLEKPGVLTSAGVIAIGFGDIAQIEYRHTEAIGVTGLNAPVPAVGVQLKLPIPAHSGIPAVGIAFRLGVPRSETLEGKQLDETVTDLFLVGRLRFASVPWLTLHGGTRISSAKATPADAALARQATLWLPTAGYEIAMTDMAKIIGEISLAPQFQWAPSSGDKPTIGHGVLGRFGMRWRILPAVVIDGSLGYQVDDAAPTAGFDAVVSWDIRLGAEVFVPWGALACRAVGVFCE